MKFGFVVPVYRHGSVLARLLESLAIYSFPVIVVDDGNDEAERHLIEDAVSKFNFAYLVRLEKNSGKGGAFFAGVRKALELDLTHLLQIDADGQHDSKRCGFFFEQAKVFPDAVICGYPEYDESVPDIRKNGREFSNRWARFVSWDYSIKDVLCGFRLYPLDGLSKLLKIQFLMNMRMGFDVDVLVRLAWKGIKIISFPVAVTYPEDGVSNFRMVRDNIGISATFTKLCIGMIFRIPMLTFRLIKRRIKGDK